ARILARALRYGVRDLAGAEGERDGAVTHAANQRGRQFGVLGKDEALSHDDPRQLTGLLIERQLMDLAHLVALAAEHRTPLLDHRVLKILPAPSRSYLARFGSVGHHADRCSTKTAQAETIRQVDALGWVAARQRIVRRRRGVRAGKKFRQGMYLLGGSGEADGAVGRDA